MVELLLSAAAGWDLTIMLLLVKCALRCRTRGGMRTLNVLDKIPRMAMGEQ